MSLTSHTDHKLINKASELTTSRQDFYTAKAKLPARFVNIWICNKSGSGGATYNYTLEYYNAATTTYINLAKNEEVAKQAHALIQGNELPLMALSAGDKICVTGSANSVLDCVVSITEISARPTDAPLVYKA